MSNPSSTNLGAGHIVCNLLSAFVLFILVEYPLRTSITVFILPRLTHTDLLKKHFFKENAESKEKTAEAAFIEKKLAAL